MGDPRLRRGRTPPRPAAGLSRFHVTDPDPSHHDPSLALRRAGRTELKHQRATVTTQRIVRSTAVADFVKRAHDYTSQVCDIRLPAPTGAYAEAAHIKPLGRPHSGPDIAANVLRLCPNHHVLFDLGILTVADDLTITSPAGGTHRKRLREVATHQIGHEYLAHHAQLPATHHKTSRGRLLRRRSSVCG
ncbi:HNH endonuclease [Streptomyces sp. NPDC046931]|uniref:HNH endonuclease n=1 Tax=Streptomyces sp. NPDC046931 TaxID=3154806 RepID=UPI0034093707